MLNPEPASAALISSSAVTAAIVGALPKSATTSGMLGKLFASKASSAAFTVVAVTASGPLEIKAVSFGVTISAVLDIVTLFAVEIAFPEPTPAVVAPAGSAEGLISVTLAKYFVDVATPALAPVKVSVIAEPAASVPVITKVFPASFPTEVIVTCRPTPLLSKAPAPDVRTKLASPVTVALVEITSASAVPTE